LFCHDASISEKRRRQKQQEPKVRLLSAGFIDDDALQEGNQILGFMVDWTVEEYSGSGNLGRNQGSR
jgi:hypothetical protein